MEGQQEEGERQEGAVVDGREEGEKEAESETGTDIDGGLRQRRNRKTEVVEVGKRTIDVLKEVKKRVEAEPTVREIILFIISLFSFLNRTELGSLIIFLLTIAWLLPFFSVNHDCNLATVPSLLDDTLSIVEVLFLLLGGFTIDLFILLCNYILEER